MKVGINTAFFQNWGGGIDFLSLVLRGLKNLPNEMPVEIVFFVPIEKPNMLQLSWVQAKSILKKILGRKHAQMKWFDPKVLQNALADTGSYKWILYNPKKEPLESLCLKEEIEVLLPCFESLGSQFPIPWVGYIFDFQHELMPELFTAKEIEHRRKLFGTTLQDAPAVMVNSIEVRKHISQFYPTHKSQVGSLTFCPFYDFNAYPLASTNSFLLEPNQYFLVCNQFWKHKDHASVFKAYARFLNKHPNSTVKLVCTGLFSDYRDIHYTQFLKDLLAELKIEDKVVLTGYVSKAEQKAMMKNAIALVQPTLFEGGPGGGSVYEAIGMGVKVVLSDIEINKEIDCGSILFFKQGNPADLAQKMEEIQFQPSVEAAQIGSDQLKREKLLGIDLYQLILAAQKGVSS